MAIFGAAYSNKLIQSRALGTTVTIALETGAFVVHMWG
jgi:hypothetical protein